MLGTFEHPFDTFTKGLVAVPDGGGMLALHGDTYTFSGTLTLNRRVTINAYEFPAQIGR